MKYLTYDESGNLTGAYIQDLLDEHQARYIEVSDADYVRWTTLRMNAGRTALEPIPGPDEATVLARDRERAWELIKAKRSYLHLTGGYAVTIGDAVKWFHSDPDSKIQQLGLFVMGSAVPPVPWKTMDGSFVTMSQTIAAQIFTAAATQNMSIFAAAEAHNTAMRSATDPLSYDFTAGWPAVFGG